MDSTESAASDWFCVSLYPGIRKSNGSNPTTPTGSPTIGNLKTASPYFPVPSSDKSYPSSIKQKTHQTQPPPEQPVRGRTYKNNHHQSTCSHLVHPEEWPPQPKGEPFPASAAFATFSSSFCYTTGSFNENWGATRSFPPLSASTANPTVPSATLSQQPSKMSWMTPSPNGPTWTPPMTRTRPPSKTGSPAPSWSHQYPLALATKSKSSCIGTPISFYGDDEIHIIPNHI